MDSMAEWYGAAAIGTILAPATAHDGRIRQATERRIQQVSERREAPGSRRPQKG
jgi:hypothetical protein